MSTRSLLMAAAGVSAITTTPAVVTLRNPQYYSGIPSGGTSHTFTNVIIGDAASDRYVVFNLLCTAGSAQSVTSVTIGGITATAYATSYTNSTQTFRGYYALVPSGTTANIQINVTANISTYFFGVVWTITNTEGIYDFAAGYSSQSLDVPQNSALVASAWTGAINGTTWSGITETYDAATEYISAGNEVSALTYVNKSIGISPGGYIIASSWAGKISSGGGGQTYSSFNTHISTLNSPTAKAGNTSASATGTCYVTSITEAGTMWGSPWGNLFTDDSVLSRVVQHALPSYTVFSDIVTNSRAVHLTVEAMGTQTTFVALGRNNYTSSSYSSWAGMKCTKIIYWDQSLGKAQQLDPFSSGSPTDYTW